MYNLEFVFTKHLVRLEFVDVKICSGSRKTNPTPNSLCFSVAPTTVVMRLGEFFLSRMPSRKKIPPFLLTHKEAVLSAAAPDRVARVVLKKRTNHAEM